MMNSIFVFSDDLDIFKDAEAAEAYIEPWLLDTKVSVFDASGRVLNCSIEKQPSRFIWGLFGGTKEAVKVKDSQQMNPSGFREKLISYLKTLEQHNGRQSSVDLTPDINLEILVKVAVEMKGYTS